MAAAVSASGVTDGDYDLVVIGAGSGGLEAAYNSAVLHKARVAVVEPQLKHGPPHFAALGGTCVNVGCVPKKLLVIGAGYRHAFADSVGFGWNVDVGALRHDWGKMQAAKDAAVEGINQSYVEMFEEAKMDLYQGWATVEPDGHTVAVHKRSPLNGVAEEDDRILTLRGRHLLIATGSWPRLPAIPGIEHAITSNEAFYLPTRPERVLIVGGGYIAVEFANILNGFGSAVTLLYRGELFLRGFDRDVREELRAQMSQYPGLMLVFGDNPRAIERLEDGSLQVVTEKGATLVVDAVLYAIGREPRSALGLEAAGVALTAAKGVQVDEYGRTSVPHIFAIGDVTDRIQLTPVAIHEGAAVADTMFGEARPHDHRHVASAVFSVPPIGTVGLIEEAAAQQYPVVAVYKTSFTPMMHKVSGAAYKKFLIKVVTDHSTGRVLGVHLLGADAAEIIQPVAIAVKMGATIRDFYTTIGVHPTSAEELCSMRTPSYYFVAGARSDTPEAP
eukprot:EG_transcript_7967